MAEFGTKVKAYPTNPDTPGPLVGFVVGHEDDKDLVQVGATVHPLAHREPADYDDGGPNGTYCSI